MLVITAVLAILALIIVIAHMVGRAPLSVAVLLLAIIAVIQTVNVLVK